MVTLAIAKLDLREAHLDKENPDWNVKVSLNGFLAVATLRKVLAGRDWLDRAEKE